MGRLDAGQYGVKTSVGSHRTSTSGKGLTHVDVAVWYLKVAKKIKVRVRGINAKTNNGAAISEVFEVPWPGGGDITSLRKNLAALSKKYARQAKSGSWPVEKNYLELCNRPFRSDWVATKCATCTAGYCTQER
jgi:hypothetical protein